MNEKGDCSPPPPKRRNLDESVLSPEKEKESADTSGSSHLHSDSISADSSFENDTRPLQRGRQSEARATTVSPAASGRHEHAADVVPVFSNSRDASASNKPPVNRIIPIPRPQSSSRPSGRPSQPPSSPSSSLSPSSNHSAGSYSPLICKHKFVPREDLVQKIMDMGICRNGATKALYWTGNKSAVAASNWIFDQPDRDLDTPLEDELEMIRAQQREEKEEQRRMRIHAQAHHCYHHYHAESIDSEDLDESFEEEDEFDDEEEVEEEEEEDEEDMEFKMVFVVNRALDMSPGTMTKYVSKATSGLFRKINGEAQSVSLGPDALGIWSDMGERTVILYADTEQHIKDLELMARRLQLPSYMLELRAEVRSISNNHGPSGKAVLGIFGDEREVNKVTGRLKVVP